ncbi:MAG: hypothetical protein IPG88_27445 [Gemmatimonadetes bacterium]|nr:hypothetical protein [Gemmatimonadota bacterium]
MARWCQRLVRVHLQDQSHPHLAQRTCRRERAHTAEALPRAGRGAASDGVAPRRGNARVWHLETERLASRDTRRAGDPDAIAVAAQESQALSAAWRGTHDGDVAIQRQPRIDREQERRRAGNGRRGEIHARAAGREYDGTVERLRPAARGVAGRAPLAIGERLRCTRRCDDVAIDIDQPRPHEFMPLQIPTDCIEGAVPRGGPGGVLRQLRPGLARHEKAIVDPAIEHLRGLRGAQVELGEFSDGRLLLQEVVAPSCGPTNGEHDNRSHDQCGSDPRA